MPALSHELFVELFRSRAELACDLLRACAGIELAGTTTELASIDLSQIAPTEYRADVVVLRRDDLSAPTAAVIVEVQTRVDADKHRTWPLYVAALRAIHACPVVLLVFTPTESVARWRANRSSSATRASVCTRSSLDSRMSHESLVRMTQHPSS